MIELTILIPAHNERGTLNALTQRLLRVLETVKVNHEILFVDDGSTDTTLDELRLLAQQHASIRVLALSRNFGKEAALAAGLDHAQGAAVIIMDADLQQPPELIPAMIAKWREGFATVYGARIDRHSDSALRRFVSQGFYRLFGRISKTTLPEGAGDFRLIDRKVVEALRRLPERARFTKGLYAWVGFNATSIPYDHVDREAGHSQWGFKRLFSLALDGVTAFSTAPLRVSTYAGLIISLGAFAYGLYFITKTIVLGIDVPGYQIGRASCRERVLMPV